MYKLIESYLNDIHQQLKTDSKIMYHKSYSNCGKVSKGVPQGSILEPILPATANNISTPILFADNTIILIMNSNPRNFINNTIEVFQLLTEWFNSNQLSLISNKFISSNLSQEMHPVLTFELGITVY
jgi:hypothetical protein